MRCRGRSIRRGGWRQGTALADEKPQCDARHAAGRGIGKDRIAGARQRIQLAQLISLAHIAPAHTQNVDDDKLLLFRLC